MAEGIAFVRLNQDKAGEWRWRAVAHNGEPIADSAEGYRSKESALEGIRLNYGDVDVRVVAD